MAAETILVADDDQIIAQLLSKPLDPEEVYRVLCRLLGRASESQPEGRGESR
jgi:hypothetical protein